MFPTGINIVLLAFSGNSRAVGHLLLGSLEAAN